MFARTFFGGYVDILMWKVSDNFAWNMVYFFNTPQKVNQR